MSILPFLHHALRGTWIQDKWKLERASDKSELEQNGGGIRQKKRTKDKEEDPAFPGKSWETASGKNILRTDSSGPCAPMTFNPITWLPRARAIFWDFPRGRRGKCLVRHTGCGTGGWLASPNLLEPSTCQAWPLIMKNPRRPRKRVEVGLVEIFIMGALWRVA